MSHLMAQLACPSAVCRGSRSPLHPRPVSRVQTRPPLFRSVSASRDRSDPSTTCIHASLQANNTKSWWWYALAYTYVDTNHWAVAASNHKMSSSPPLKPDDLSFSDLSLLTTPPSKSAPKGNASKSSSSILSHPRVSSQDRAGVSQRSAAGASSSVESNLRMLQGVNQSSSSGAPPVSGRNRGPHDGNKRRASLFAPSAIPKRDNADSISTAQQSERAGALEEEGEDSLLQAMQTPNGKAAPVAVPTLPSSFTRKAQGSALSEAAHDTASSDATDGSQQAETKEQVQRQFDELSRMNATFSAYERMLQGTAGQIEVSSGFWLTLV